MWRKTAADILLTISRHCLNKPVVSYLHGKSWMDGFSMDSLIGVFFHFSLLSAKGCLSLCLENMNKNTNASPLETVEMFVTVFCFLKDSSQSTETLQEDFRTCQGYIFLTEFLLRWVVIFIFSIFLVWHICIRIQDRTSVTEVAFGFLSRCYLLCGFAIFFFKKS